ncbi:type II secretion system F family protein [Thermodesulfovibrio hydrogeniphilus]
MSYFFFYRGLTPEGKTVNGFIKADSEAEAIRILTIRELYLTSFMRISSAFSPILLLFTRKTRAKDEDLVEIASNLSVMIKAGLPITVALSDIAENLQKKTLKSIIIDIKEMVEKGMSLSEAFATYKDVFPPIFYNLVRIGEETGRLEKSFEDIAEHFKRILELKTAIKRALIYPAFATTFTLLAMIFWIIYVLPKVINAMKDMGVKIPFITRLLADTGQLLLKYYYLIPVLILLIFFAFKFSKKHPRLKRLRDILSFKLPIIKNISYNRAVAIFCEQMRILFGAGVPIDQTLDRTKEAVGNILMAEAIERSKERIVLGEGIANSFRKEPIFPPMVIRMIDVGETAGNLEEQLNFLSQYYISRMQEFATRLGKVIEPVMIAVLGLFFALVMISLFIPLYDLISKLGQM